MLLQVHNGQVDLAECGLRRALVVEDLARRHISVGPGPHCRRAHQPGEVRVETGPFLQVVNDRSPMFPDDPTTRAGARLAEP